MCFIEDEQLFSNLILLLCAYYRAERRDTWTRCHMGCHTCLHLHRCCHYCTASAVSVCVGNVQTVSIFTPITKCANMQIKSKQSTKLSFGSQEETSAREKSGVSAYIPVCQASPSWSHTSLKRQEKLYLPPTQRGPHKYFTVALLLSHCLGSVVSKGTMKHSKMA